MSENNENKSGDNKIIDVDLKTSGDFKERLIAFLKSPLIISLVVIVVLSSIVIAAVIKSRPPELPQAPMKEAATGKLDNPKVTMESYEDFSCPYCGAFNSVYDNLIEKYKGKDVKFVFHQYPFLSSNSITASEASEYANDKGKFWEYKDRLFTEQQNYYKEVGGEDPSFLKVDNLVKWGSELGLDGNDMRKNIEGRTYKDRVQKSLDEGKARGVNSTPTVFINGQQFQTDASKGIYLDLESISKIIDDALNK